MRIYSILLGLFLFFSLSSKILAANIVINEILPNPDGPSSEDSEWIELYNTTDNSIDISGWLLDDSDGSGSNPYALPSGSVISAKGFLTFEKSSTNIALNNDNDTVRISSSSGELIDSISYSETKETQSYGRKQDASGDWVWFSTPSKKSSNSSGTIVPTSTVVPTATVMPTQTLAPTQTPTPTKTPTPTLKLSPTQMKKSPTSKPLAFAEKPKDLNILGEKTSTYDHVPTINPHAAGDTSEGSTLSLGTVFISIGGMFLIACGILAFSIYKKKK